MPTAALCPSACVDAIIRWLLPLFQVSCSAATLATEEYNMKCPHHKLARVSVLPQALTQLHGNPIMLLPKIGPFLVSRTAFFTVLQTCMLFGDHLWEPASAQTAECWGSIQHGLGLWSPDKFEWKCRPMPLSRGCACHSLAILKRMLQIIIAFRVPPPTH